MIRLHPEVFKLSEPPTFETIKTPNAAITIIKNFYEDFEAVQKEVKKLPGAVTGGLYGRFQGKDFWDLRKSYTPTMIGTSLPVFDQLPKIVSSIIGIDQERISVHHQLLINSFQKLESFPKDVFFAAHIDSPVVSGSQVAIVVFLNSRYERGEGLNFYSSFKKYPRNQSPYSVSSETPLCWFVQGEPNTAVLFDSNYAHGQASEGGQFFKEWRETQAIFVGVSHRY